jgi:hypothetical protein
MRRIKVGLTMFDDCCEYCCEYIHRFQYVLEVMLILSSSCRQFLGLSEEDIKKISSPVSTTMCKKIKEYR